MLTFIFRPELFPTPQRGTGNALTASCNRIFGIMAVSDAAAVPMLAWKGEYLTDTSASLLLQCSPTLRRQRQSIRLVLSSSQLAFLCC
jgi:hypothetical protein